MFSIYKHNKVKEKTEFRHHQMNINIGLQHRENVTGQNTNKTLAFCS